ncbi:glycosyltransferase involved in cell wall biosynthesis [Motilibacter peucedani]|uniref:Glycosyltransferase involved in cell wall biosynthesis n=1 Tax=Motilibacter peucedani TaxID=598650 RepID=A0A420XLV2_9ACTN|nr:glycosyltransferase family 4 protein [Motilibacter peucedani]RKS71485.1 glycosyltransferase involved in cell wall biosynthesis [Motilibacter peucedani]
MLVTSDVANDSRVVREATTLAGAGHSVHVVGRDVPAGWAPPAGVTVHSAGGGTGLRRGGAQPRTLPPHLRAARWALLPRHNAGVLARWTAAAETLARGIDADVVHAHDFNTLALGARLAAAKGARLVYDTHEFWSGRPRTARPTPWATRRDLTAEKALGARADAVVTVGPGVATLLRRRFGWEHVTVVRNTFPALESPLPLAAAPVGAVYAGRMAPYRELETIAAAARSLPELEVTCIGPADETWLASFDAGPVRVRPSVPLPEAEALLASAGLALVTHSARWLNHRVALPNKLFLAVRVGVPVVATDVDELAGVVRAHGLGTLYAPGDSAGLVRAVREAVERWPELVGNVRAAQHALSWETDGAALLGVYERLGQ